MGIHCSPFGVILKKNRPKWLLILDLSSPQGYSVNDGIKELVSLSYVSIDEVVSQILLLGQGCLLAKMDIKQAYRNIPVHPDDRWLSWDDGIFVYKVLPFGLCTAPWLLTALADALGYIMLKRGVSFMAHLFC